MRYYSLTVLEAIKCKIKCQPSYALSEALGRILPCLFQLLVAASNFGPSLVCGSVTPSLPLSQTLGKRASAGERLGLREVGYVSRNGPRPVASCEIILLTAV